MITSALTHSPVFAICGYSGAGKTTLILDLIGRLSARGLGTLVVKHDAHGLDVDMPTKDTDRFFRAGADVWARDVQQVFVRRHDDDEGLVGLLARAQRRYDVILVEGYKATPLPNKLWLRRHARDTAPSVAKPVALDLGRDDDRGDLAWLWLEGRLANMHAQAPTFAGILVGGRSSRMGRDKHLLLDRGQTWLTRIESAVRPLVEGVVLLGSGPAPRSRADLVRLPDAPGRAGPVAGMCAAMRWHPTARWIFLPCDAPLLSTDALAWLKQQARPGVWAVQPRLSGRARPEPLPGWYDPRAAAVLELAAGPSYLAQHPRTISPLAPRERARDFLGCNNPAERRRLLGHKPIY